MGNKGVKFKDSSGNAVYPCPYYPVGSIYMSVNNISPETFFCGTWEQIKDVFLLSAGDTYKAGATGGEAEHILTVAEMPKHSHVQRARNENTSGYANQVLGGYAFSSQSSEVSTDVTGGDKAHNNMPPYLAVYVWKRTA